MFKRLFAKLFVSKKRKDILEEFAEILLEVPKAKTVADCYAGYKRVATFNAKLDDKNDGLREMNGKLIEYLMDTKEHIQKGYHRSKQSGWKVRNTYPDINDYLAMLKGEVKIARF